MRRLFMKFRLPRLLEQAVQQELNIRRLEYFEKPVPNHGRNGNRVE